MGFSVPISPFFFVLCLSGIGNPFASSATANIAVKVMSEKLSPYCVAIAITPSVGLIINTSNRENFEELIGTPIHLIVRSFLKQRAWKIACADTSGTVTREDQRSYIKIETLRGKNPTHIHCALREICDEQAVHQSTVSRWALRFREGCISISDGPKSGRPRTAAEERSGKLVAEFIEEDRRATCGAISNATGISATSILRILTEESRKRKISATWVPHGFPTWLRNKNRLVWSSQHRWSKHFWLKAMDSCYEMLLSMKHGLGISNLS